MILYCWTIASGSTSHAPRATGVTADREVAIRESERYLKAGEGFLAIVEAARPAVTTNSMDSCYERLGIAWLGRRTRDGGVHWSRIIMHGGGIMMS